MKNQLYAKLIEYTRINGSVNGNPNYEVTLELGDGTYEYLRSSSDSSWCYAIGNNWVGKSIAYTLTRSGRINYMKKLELTDVFADPIFNDRKDA
jgi:hypothetical protein